MPWTAISIIVSALAVAGTIVWGVMWLERRLTRLEVHMRYLQVYQQRTRRLVLKLIRCILKSTRGEHDASRKDVGADINPAPSGE